MDPLAGTHNANLETEEFREGPMGATIREQKVSPSIHDLEVYSCIG
jgi:hypothetical protein